MMFLAFVALWWLIGVVVAARSIPWRDVSLHAPWARMRTDGGAPSSPMADSWFFVFAVVFWPVSWRWSHVARWNEPTTIHREQSAMGLTADDLHASVGPHGDRHRQLAFSDPRTVGDGVQGGAARPEHQERC
jgi:hypothetical protein